MRIVKLNGIFDHTKEIEIVKDKNGEKGVEVITPFYTHLDEQGNPCGISVNRGWIAKDNIEGMKYRYAITKGDITGVLYPGDPQTKYSLPNNFLTGENSRADPYDFSLVHQLPNKEEASKFMLLQVDTNPKARQIVPSCPDANELTKFRISPERHEAYSSLWRMITLVGVVANTTLWLYF